MEGAFEGVGDRRRTFWVGSCKVRQRVEGKKSLITQRKGQVSGLYKAREGKTEAREENEEGGKRFRELFFGMGYLQIIACRSRTEIVVDSHHEGGVGVVCDVAGESEGEEDVPLKRRGQEIPSRRCRSKV